MKFLYSTALTLVASIALAGAEPEGQLRKLVLTKPPIDTRCPLTNQMLFPTQQAFRQNEGGFMKLKITNPLDVAIPGPIVVNYRFPNGTRGPPDFRATGGYFAYPLGSTEITNRYARRAKSSWGVRPAEISADRRSVVFTLAGISARKSVNLVVLIDIGAGTQRSTNIIANATYTFEGTACLSRSNQLALSPYITPVATLDTTSNGQRVIYQQYASAYRICRSSIGVFNFTTPQNCAAECNKNSDCQGFVMAAPTNTDFGNRTCKLYDGSPGSSKTLNYGDAQGNSTTGRLGETIYLQSRNPDRYIISANPCTFT